MKLREKILKTFVVTIGEVNRHGGPASFFHKYPVGGMYYMHADGPFNAEGRECGSGMSLETLKECQKYAPEDMLFCADDALMSGQTFPICQRTLGAIADENLAYTYGKIIGMQMNALGIDWVLAPSIDMLFSSGMPLMAISNDPVFTAKIYRQVVRGIQDQGVCATIKHFPGLGTDNVNMHYAPGRNILSFDKWKQTYGYTYTEVFKEHPLAVMNTHTSLASYDSEYTDGYPPIATYSKRLNQDLLRKELGFTGAIVTDALIMGGMATGKLVEETAQAFKCGADLLLWPPIEAAERIESMILSGEIPMQRLDDALANIQAMCTFRKNALEEGKYSTPDVAYVNEQAELLTAAGICCLKNDIGLLPLSPEKYKKILIMDATDTPNDISVLFLKEALERRGIHTAVVREAHDAVSIVWWPNDVERLQEGWDLIIFNVNGQYLHTWNNTFMTIWGSHMFDKHRKVIVNYGSPFFAVECFPDDPTIVELNCDPSEFAAQAFVDRLFGEKPFTGNPVLHNL